MMKKIAAFALILLGSFQAFSQAPDYDDLKILFADGKYEKLTKYADNYTQKENLKKDPIPYVWLAKGLHKISISGTKDENFKNAFKDAIGAMTKAFKLDKDSTLMNEFGDFIAEFQVALGEYITNDLTAKDYAKASGWAMKYSKISYHPIGAQYIDGAAKYRKADKGTALTIWKTADAEVAKLIAKNEAISEWTEADLSLFRTGIFSTAECLIDGKQVPKAKALLSKVEPLFAEDEEFKTRSEELNALMK
jgi:hypothetical protein